MCQQPGRICQQLLLLCSPCQARAQLVHHLCKEQESASHLCLSRRFSTYTLQLRGQSLI